MSHTVSAWSIERELRERAARPTTRKVTTRGDIVFDAGKTGAWTVKLDAGGARVAKGKSWRPATTLTADPETLLAVLQGRVAGVDAFLRQRLFVRGNLALSLELDDLVPPQMRDMRAPRCHRVTALDVQTFYLEAGPQDAPTLVLLHGLGATSASFLPTIWDLAGDYHVIVPDLPGFGESEKPLRPLHPAFFARWLAAFVDLVAGGRASFIGNSMGGRIALEMGMRFPERCEKLVLLAPSMAWLRFRFGAGVARILRPELAVTPMVILHAFVMQTLRFLFAEPDRVPKEAMAAAADEFLRVFSTARGRIAFFSAAREIYLEEPHGEKGFWNRLPSLATPSLFIFGDRDRLVPRGFAKFVGRALPRAQVEILYDCGHVPQYEHPERTNGLMRRFLRGT